MKREFIFFILVIFLISYVSASVIVGNLSQSIESSYGPDESIRGWINISLDEESANSVLESLFDDLPGGNISLINLIKKDLNLGFEYTCTPSDCMSDYSGENEEDSKIIELKKGESALIGLKLPSGTGIQIEKESFRIDLESNNPESEELPLTIDILDDGEIEWNAYESSEDFGAENFGCFQDLGDTTQKLIYTQAQCEKVHLGKAPGVEVGAYIDYNNDIGREGNANFEIKIKNFETGFSKSCTASQSGAGENLRVSCIQDFSIEEEGDYFVCIKTQTSGDNGEYKIASEQTAPCGFIGDYLGEYSLDFEIFARPKKYASSINITLNDGELINYGHSKNIENDIANYVNNKYGSDCSEGCEIPIKIYAGVDQTINLSNANLAYSSAQGYIILDKIYDLSETPAKINSGFQKLYLKDAKFNTPLEYGNYVFSLKLNSEKLISKEISVEEVPQIQSLTPLDTAVKYPTKFKITLTSNRNVTKYEWDFGGGANSQTTTQPEATYTYSNVGEYIVTVTATDITGKSSSREFNVTVEPASTVVPKLLDGLKVNIQNIKTQMETFSDFEKKSLNSLLNIDGNEISIAELDEERLVAESEADYESILEELLEINIPNSVSKTISSEGILFYPDTDNIDLNILKNIGGGDYESEKEDAYKSSILAWGEENTDVSLSYNEISLIYEDYEEPFLRVFKFDVTNQVENPYMIISDMDNLLFKEDYSEEKEDGYYYITLNEGENNIVFSTTDNVDFISVPAFISPKISKLSLAEWTPVGGDEEVRKWVLRWVFFSVIIVIVLLIAVIIWVILQLWYKKKYENYLFKNQNNLYNLINFIEAEREKGKTDRDIISKLRKTGWKSEQIRYAMRKYSGRRTGMFEIPLENIFGKKNGKKGANGKTKFQGNNQK